MPRKSTVDETRLLPFAAWLMQNIKRRGYSVQRVADHAEMHVSHLHKIIKSYLPAYSQYQRPGYEKTVMIGKFFGDVRGALESAGYEDELQPTEVHDNHPVYDFLEGQPRPVLDKAERLLRAAFAEDDAEDNAANIGKRTD